MPQLNKPSTTSYFAIICAVGILLYCFGVTFWPVLASETTVTQIIQGLFGLLMFIAGYYFGTSKNRPGAGTNVQNADEVNVNTNKTAESEGVNDPEAK